jgi:uncharacterized LabA/DUF88 family protein
MLGSPIVSMQMGQLWFLRGFEQKRVDTLIAVDMLSKTYENHYDIAILLSGDEDHMPVVDAVKNTGKRVFGIFFESGISPMLKEYFDAYFVTIISFIHQLKENLEYTMYFEKGCILQVSN